MFGGGDGVARGRINYHNTAAGGRFDINVVHANAGPADDNQFFAGFDNCRGDRSLTTHYHAFIVTDDLN